MKKLLVVFILLLTLFGCKPNDQMKRLDIPQNLTHEESLISFDAVEYATSYVLEINGEEVIISTTSYLLTTSGDFSIRVKARAEGFYDSFYSDRYTFNLPLHIEDIRYNYSTYSSFDLIIYTFDEDVTISSIMLEDETISSTHYSYTNHQLIIHASYLDTLTPLLHEYEVSLGSKGSFAFFINIIDTNLPYMISYNNVSWTENQDVVIEFELFAGTIQGLSSGYEILPEDYVIDDNELIINSTYISQYFLEFTSQSTLSIRYTLQLNDQYVIGYIFINRNT